MLHVIEQFVDDVTVVETEPHLEALIDAAEAEDAVAFVQAAQRVDWSQQSAENFVAAIHLALAAGAHWMARELSAQGQRLYPAHADLQKLAHILAPPRVKVGERASGKSRRKDFAWLKHHSAPYRGQWVALREGELVAAASTIPELKAKVSSPQSVFLAKVP